METEEKQFLTHLCSSALPASLSVETASCLTHFIFWYFRSAAQHSAGLKSLPSEISCQTHDESRSLKVLVLPGTTWKQKLLHLQADPTVPPLLPEEARALFGPVGAEVTTRLVQLEPADRCCINELCCSSHVKPKTDVSKKVSNSKCGMNFSFSNISQTQRCWWCFSFNMFVF